VASGVPVFIGKIGSKASFPLFLEKIYILYEREKNFWKNGIQYCNIKVPVKHTLIYIYIYYFS